MTDFAVLHSAACTVILELPPGEAPLWRYWGPRLPDGVTPDRGLRAIRPLPSFHPDVDQPLSIFPGLGVGWFGQSALLAHRDGRDWTFQPTACAVEASGATSLHVVLSDAVARIDVAMTLSLDPETNVLSLSSRLTNGGDATLDVQWLAAGGIPLPPDAVRVRSYTGRHNSEFVAIDDPLTRSLWRRENRRGLTSHDCFPGAVVQCGDGTVYGAQFAWSGNHVQSIDWTDDGRFHWQMGEWLAPGEVRLAPGDSIETPTMLATCAPDANGVAQHFHAAIRTRVTWPGGTMRSRPVHLNTWEGFYFRHDLDALKALADSAAEAGIERYVLDDGWFRGRNDDTSALGDWDPDPAKYPQGLAPLADHVVALGMEFGLWVEPEMVNPDSDLCRANPDWALQIEGRPQITARNQLVLDMSRPEVCDYLHAKIAALLASLPISYLKWDHNRDLTTAGARPAFRAQVLGAYALMARLRDDFPHVEIEACAGGGGRIDAGIVRHTHRFWVSDNNDALNRVAIQRGFLQFMPPELMGAHIGAAPAHATGRVQSLNFRAGVALPGHLGVEFDVRNAVGDERDTLKRWIATYKAHRDLLHSGQVWLGDAGDGVLWQAHGTPDRLLLFVIRMTPTTQRYPPSLRLAMLDRDGAYDVIPAKGPSWRVSGAWLDGAGLALPAMRAEQVRLYEIVRAGG
jgi:alpha-galactosidase